MLKLIGLLIISLTTFRSISQTVSTTDTGKTCLPNVQLREMMRLNEVRKVQAKELALVKDQVDILDQKVALKDSTITMFEQRNKTVDRMVVTYDSSIANLKGQIVIEEAQKLQLTKDLKTANKKKLLNKIFYGGIAAIAVVLLAVK